MFKISKIILAGGLILAAFAGGASAAVVLVTDRAALGGTDFYDWSTLGPDGTYVPEGTSVTSNGGLGATLSLPSGTMLTREQGVGWNGYFATGDGLLMTSFFANELIIDFDGPVQGAGAQIAWGVLSVDYVAEITAFDNGGGLLGSFTIPVSGGISGVGGNGASFLGIQSDSMDIASITFEIIGTPPGIFTMLAINQLDIVTQVPAPGALTLFGFGLLGMAALRRRRKA
ncbi:MAG: PEP-CTERM sorting domain-containing protein [Emcibacter sp.]|nr:PEP-CTERM sorting domain-containing protein [Emcibacter sp.]